MSTITIAAKELYIDISNSLVKQEAEEFYKKDHPASIEKYKKFCAKATKEFAHGHHFTKNVFMMAAFESNLTLVKFIIEHADIQTLNMRDQRGRNALFYTAYSYFGSTDKAITCAQALIDGGVDLNACGGFIETPLSYLPDVSRFKSHNVMGHLTTVLERSQRARINRERICKIKYFLQFFIAQGAVCHIRDLGTIEPNQRYACAGEKNIEKKYQNELKDKYSIALKEAEDKVIDWKQLRLLFMALNDNRSSLFSMPKELAYVIFQKYIFVPFYKMSTK